MITDVTDQVQFGANDDSLLPLTKCVCGAEFGSWERVLWEGEAELSDGCPECGRKFFFTVEIKVFEVS